MSWCAGGHCSVRPPAIQAVAGSLNRLNVEIKANLYEKAVFLLSLNLVSGLKVGASSLPPAVTAAAGAPSVGHRHTWQTWQEGPAPLVVFCVCR